MIDNLNLQTERIFFESETKTGTSIYSLPHKKTPFIIILHCLGKNEKWISNISELLPKNTFILCIRGRLDWKVDGDESFAWFDIKGPFIDNFCKEDDILESSSHIKKIIDETKEKFPFLDNPILLGFSQGGIVALTIAVEKLFDTKGVYCHCGFYETKLNSGQSSVETPILVSNGTQDPVIPIDWFYRTKKILSEKCKNISFIETESGHENNEKTAYHLMKWINTLLEN